MREKRKKKLTRVFQTKPNQKKQQPKRGYGRALLECCETVARALPVAPKPPAPPATLTALFEVDSG